MVLRMNVVNIKTNTLAVKSSVLTMVRMTKPVGKAKLDSSVASPGFSARREGEPPATIRLKRAPMDKKAPARNDLRSKSGQGNRAFATPELTSRFKVSLVGSKVGSILAS